MKREKWDRKWKKGTKRGDFELQKSVDDSSTIVQKEKKKNLIPR